MENEKKMIKVQSHCFDSLVECLKGQAILLVNKKSGDDDDFYS